MKINDPGMGELFDYDKWLDEQPPMTPQPTIVRNWQAKHSYETSIWLAGMRWPSYDLLKHQYFQLLTDLNTVIAYYRYYRETGDCKV